MNVLELRSSIVESVYQEEDPTTLQWIWEKLNRSRQKKEASKDWWTALSARQLSQLEEGWSAFVKEATRPAPKQVNQTVGAFLNQFGVQDVESQEFGSKISEADFLDKIYLELTRKTLHECQDIAAKNGLSDMTLDEINAEIEEVRNLRRAKNHT